jgi:hypothetical protein
MHQTTKVTSEARRPGFRFRRLAGLLVSLVAPLCLPAAPASLGEPAPEWDALFQNTNGWIGADGDCSLALSRDTTLWLFSDTFVGEVRDGRRTNARMINNSIALQQGTNRPVFYYRTAPDGRPESFVKPKSGKGYFWLGPGVRTPGALYLFLNETITVRSDSPFGFRFVDAWLGCVTNPEAPPLQWQIAQTRLPFTKVSAKGALIFGGAVLAEPDFVYVYGSDTRPSAKGPASAGSTVLARVPPGDFGNLKKWRFLANGKWQPDFTKVTPISPAFASEFSVSRLAGSTQCVAVYTESIGGRIVLRLARAPEGPWSNPVEIYRAPEMGWPLSVFSYAGKAHPELVQTPDELLVTYAANSWSLANLVNDARLYWPRFVRVKLR